MSCHYQYCMSGAMNNVLSNGNHTNDNKTTAPPSSISVDAFTIAVALPWVRRGMYTVPNQVRQITIRDDIAISIVLYAGCDELCVVRWERYE